MPNPALFFKTCYECSTVAIVKKNFAIFRIVFVSRNSESTSERVLGHSKWRRYSRERASQTLAVIPTGGRKFGNLDPLRISCSNSKILRFDMRAQPDFSVVASDMRFFMVEICISRFCFNMAYLRQTLKKGFSFFFFFTTKRPRARGRPPAELNRKG